MDLFKLIDELLSYGRKEELVAEEDTVYVRNKLLELFQVTEYKEPSPVSPRPVHLILQDMLTYAKEKQLLEDTAVNCDLFDTKIMGMLTPPPSVVRSIFFERYKLSPQSATEFFYHFSRATNYIRVDRIAKDEKWNVDTTFGKIEISINLSKPEKDPRDIAKAATAQKSHYPACLLCPENEGYAGHFSHPARQNHRIIPITLANEQYYLQYSPYVYYNEHCIVLHQKHIPMKIDRNTFAKLLDFVGQFPHYTVGSNADLPIVGGSILSHDHFQGGGYTFPMVHAPYETTFAMKDFPSVHAGIINWPLSTIRLQSKDKDAIIDASTHILALWRNYTDTAAFLFAHTAASAEPTATPVACEAGPEAIPHSTITPIARMRGDLFEMDLVLRNNITTPEFPLGVYHPHQHYHHIKKENIGLIEVMGLAILPARLKKEMAALEEAILKGETDFTANPLTAPHAAWAAQWLPHYPSLTPDTIHAVVQKEIGLVFSHVLEDAGVYKHTDEGRKAFQRFIDHICSTPKS